MRSRLRLWRGWLHPAKPCRASSRTTRQFPNRERGDPRRPDIKARELFSSNLCGFHREHMLNLVADSVRRHQVDLLYDWCVFGWRDQEVIAERPHTLALRSGEADCGQPLLACNLQCRENVR